MGALTDIVRSSTRLEPQTRSTYLLCVQRFEGYAHDPRGWTAPTVERWRDKLLSQGLSAQTVNKHLYALRYASQRREALGQGPDFARSAEGAKSHTKKLRAALSLDEVEKILATCASTSPRDLRDRALFTVGIKTALRVSELRQLVWAGIHGRKAVIKKKGGDDHVVILDDDSLAALEAWKPRAGKSKHVFVGLATHVDRTISGKQLSRQAIHRIIKERGAQARIRRAVHPHLLRHTAVTWALDAGVPAQRVMIMTGHKSLGSLSKYVTDLDAEKNPIGNLMPSLRRT